MKRWLCALVLVLLLAEPVCAADYEELTAVGRSVGIRMREAGITVTGFSEQSSAKEAGLRKGDRILTINGETVETAEEIRRLAAGGEALTVKVERGGKEAEYLVEPVRKDGSWLLGIQVRDSISGIGTVTFYDSASGSYGALGHGVCASGTDSLLRLCGGELIDAQVTGVEKGRRGAAGQLLGEYDAAARLGQYGTGHLRLHEGGADVGENIPCGFRGGYPHRRGGDPLQCVGTGGAGVSREDHPPVSRGGNTESAS